ncbi:MAG: hypothetical protein ABSH30_00495 [Acidimicrobiales bacterium]
MPGDNFSRRVARAAASGGGRTYRAQTPVSWYLVLLAICLLGVSLVAYSRYELLHPLPAAAKASVPPTASDEWEAAVAVDICGTFVPTALPIDDLATDPLASIGDGIVRIEPSLSPQPTAYEGKGATLGAYLLIEAASVSSTLLSIPGKPVPVPTTTTTTSTTTTTTVPKGKSTTTTTSSSTTTTSSSTTTSTTAAKSTGKSTTTSSSSTTTTTVATEPGPAKNYKNGVTKCGSKPGYISVETWPHTTSSKGTIVPAAKADDTRLENGQMITIAFLPKGATIPQPPAVDRAALKSFAFEDPGGIATTTVPSTLATTSTSSTTSTTAPKSSTTSTTAAKSTTTSSSSSTTSST